MERAKKQLKASLLMQLDGSPFIVEDIGRQMQMYGRRITPAETFARIDAIDIGWVKDVASQYIVKRSQIERTVALSSASLPSEFTRMISRYQDDPESLYAAGIDYAVQQLRDLIEGGADGVHLYAMNDAKVAAAVYEGIKDLL